MTASAAPESDLPQDIQALIIKVVRRTGLWLREKRDVRAELASHFREGMNELAQEGMPPEQAATRLCEQFGNPRTAARLIRRGKKRARPLIWKMFVAVWRGFILTLLLIALYVGWIFTGRPTPSVDYVAKMNAPVDAVPESQRAWPILRQVVLDFKPISQKMYNDWNHGNGLKPSDPEWPAVLAWVQSNRHLLLEIRKAAQRSTCGFRYDNHDSLRFIRELEQRRVQPGSQDPAGVFAEAPEDPLAPRVISILLPHAAHYRELARYLVMDAQVRLASGDFDDAWESLDAAHRLGFQMLSLNTVIEQLVGIAIVNFSTDAARAALYDRRATLTSAQIRTIRSSHLINSPAETIRCDVRFERDAFEDLVQYLFTDNGRGDGHLIPTQLGRASLGIASSNDPISEGVAILHASRKATLTKYHELWNRMESTRRLPLSDPTRTQADDVVQALNGDPIQRRRYLLVVSMIPSLNRADQVAREAAMSQSATQALLALLAYRAEIGHFPDRLEAIVPQYLSKVPIDIYSDRELRYSVAADGEFLLYSIGPNLEDNDGQSTLIRYSVSSLPRRDIVFTGKAPADIVYWPPTASPPATQPASRPPIDAGA